MASAKTTSTETVTKDDVGTVDATEVLDPNSVSAQLKAAEDALDAQVSNYTESEQTGFPPYWNPSVSCTKCGDVLGEKETVCKKHPDAALKGNRFLGTIVDLDDLNPKFKRYVLQASKVAIPCAEGSAAESKPVLAKLNDLFTCSEYSTLPLMDYMGLEVLVTTVSKRMLPANDKVPQAHPLWKFNVKVSKDVKALLQANREALAKRAKELFAERARQQLEAKIKASPVVKDGEFVEHQNNAS